MNYGNVNVSNPSRRKRTSIESCGVPTDAMPARIGVVDHTGTVIWADLIRHGASSTVYFPATFVEGEVFRSYQIVEWTGPIPAPFTLLEAFTQQAPFDINQFVGTGRVRYNSKIELVRQGHYVLSTYRFGRPKGSKTWWADSELTLFRGMPSGRLDLRFGHSGLSETWRSDYSNGEVPKVILQNMQFPVDGMDMEQESNRFVNHPALGYVEERVFDTNSVVGNGPGFMAEGQSIAVSGRVIFQPIAPTQDDLDTMLAEGTLPCVAMWDGWAKHYGPHKRVAEFKGSSAAMLGDASRRTARSHAKQRAYNQTAWRVDYEISEFDSIGSAGDQPGICVSKFADVINSGDPIRLYHALADMRAFARRSIWLREADGSCLLQSNHPHLQIWSSDPNVRAPGDHLGKVIERPYRNHRRTVANWQKNNLALMGVGFEHYILAPMAQLAMLTGDHHLLRMVAEMSELYMCSMTLQGFNHRLWSPRAEARTCQFATWAYMATGNEQLGRHVAGRLALWQRTAKRGTSGLVVTEVKGPHHTNLRVPWIQWWQESLLAEAHEAAIRAGISAFMQNPQGFEDLHQTHVSGIVACGWGKTRDGKHGTLKAGAWLDGNPLIDPTHDVVYEKDKVISGETNVYTGYNTWGMMPIRLSTDAKALAIEAEFRSGRKGGGDQTYERGYMALGDRPE